MLVRKSLMLAFVGSMLALAPVTLASGGGDDTTPDDGGHHGGGGNSGSGSGSGGSGGGGGTGVSTNALRSAIRGIEVATKNAERAMNQIKDLRVVTILNMRAAGATADEVAAALADAISALQTSKATGLTQIEAARTAAQAALPSTATAGQRAAVDAAAASGVTRLNGRLVRATEDVTRAANGPLAPGMGENEHPIPEPGHPENEVELPGHRNRGGR